MSTAPTSNPGQDDEIKPNPNAREPHYPRQSMPNSRAEAVASGPPSEEPQARSVPASSLHTSETIPPRLRHSLSEVEVNSLNSVLRQLQLLQTSTGMKQRFHLFVESDNSDEVQDTQSGNNTSRFIKINTKVLFSPPISSRIRNYSHRSKLEELIRSINLNSFFIEDEDRENREASPATPDQPIQRRGFDNPSFASQQNAGVVSNPQPTITSVPFQVPDWFPYKGKEYKTPPQCSNEMLVIPDDVGKKFLEYTDSDAALLYRAFFHFLHEGSKSLNRGFKQGVLKYSTFTAPWMRKHFTIGSEVVPMDKVVVPDQKSYRNKRGYRRQKLILAAFYYREPYFGTSVLDHLIPRLPALRATEERRRNINGSAMQSITTPTTLDRSSVRQRRNQPEEIIEVEDLDSGRAKTGPNTNANHAEIQEHTGQPSYEQQLSGSRKSTGQGKTGAAKRRSAPGTGRKRLNRSLPETVISLDNESHVAALRDAMNPPQYVPKDYTTQMREIERYNKLCDEIKRKRDAEETPDERVEMELQLLDAQFEQEEAKKEQAKRSERRAGVARGLASFLERQKYLQKLKKIHKQKRPKDSVFNGLIPDPAEEEPQAAPKPPRPPPPPLQERRTPKRQATPKASRSAKRPKSSDLGQASGDNGTQQNNNVPMLMKMNGPRPFLLKISDPDNDDNVPNSAEKGSSYNASLKTSKETTQPTNTGKEKGAGGYEVLCGAGKQCRFKDNPSYQQADGISGRCRTCGTHLHDLCGGGEEGEMKCQKCKD